MRVKIVLDTLLLADAERRVCDAALDVAGSMVEAASLLGITRYALRRLIVKHAILWPRPPSPAGAGGET